jgi:hypothetical protein
LADRAATFQGEQDLTTLFSLLVLADIDLSGPSALTLGALTNDAFALLDSAVVEFSRQLPKA